MRTNGAFLVGTFCLGVALLASAPVQGRQRDVVPGGMGVHEEGGAMDHASASRQIEKMHRRRVMQQRPMERRRWR